MRHDACWPCRERKVKCDAGSTGVPCARCCDNDRSAECFVPPRQKRRILNRTARPRKRNTEVHQSSSDQLLEELLAQNISHVSDNGLAGDDVAGGNDPMLDCNNVIDGSVSTFSEPSGPQQFGSNHPAPVQSSDRGGGLISPLPSVSTGGPDDGSEENVLADICQKIASGKETAPMLATAAMEMEYQNGFNATGILGEVLARSESSKLIKLSAVSGGGRSRRDLEMLGLDEHDIAFLSAKGAFNLPSDQICQEFFEIYFRYAYPYAPILDRGELLASFSQKKHSTFLMQALLANVVPYSSNDLIVRAGFSDHATAQKIFYNRAILLYDMNCEKSQLALLQGSLLLGTQWVSYFSDKDFTFWASNAIRIATRMGINSRHVQDELEPRFYKLLKRIWWTIYIRDVLTTISGLKNGRSLRSKQCDTPVLDESDWPDDESHCPDHLRHLLPRTEIYHKHFFIQLCALAQIGSAAHSSLLELSSSGPDLLKTNELRESVYEWRLSLPRDLRIESIRNWKGEGIWILVLMAWCYRMECMLYRTVRKSLDPFDPSFAEMTQNLHAATFELDNVVRRAVTHQISKLLPMSFSTAVSTNVALCIEMLLDALASSRSKLMAEDAVKTGLAYLVECQESWPCLRWTLRMFDWAFSHSGLNFSSGLQLGTPLPLTTGVFGSGDGEAASFLFGGDSLPDLFSTDPTLLAGGGFGEWQLWLDTS